MTPPPRVDLVTQQYQAGTHDMHYDMQIYKIPTERSLQKHSRHERGHARRLTGNVKDLSFSRIDCICNCSACWLYFSI